MKHLGQILHCWNFWIPNSYNKAKVIQGVFPESLFSNTQIHEWIDFFPLQILKQRVWVPWVRKSIHCLKGLKGVTENQFRLFSLYSQKLIQRQNRQQKNWARCDWVHTVLVCLFVKVIWSNCAGSRPQTTQSCFCVTLTGNHPAVKLFAQCWWNFSFFPHVTKFWCAECQLDRLLPSFVVKRNNDKWKML